MPKRKTKKHKRVKHVKRTNKHKKSSNLTGKIPRHLQDLRNIIVELTTAICSKNDYATKLATKIINGKIYDEDLTRWCDPNIDSRKIKYFAHVSVGIVALGPAIYIRKKIIEPIDLAFYLFIYCVNGEYCNYIDKCVEWSIDFMKATQRPTCYPNSLFHQLNGGFEKPYKQYLQTKSTDLKHKMLHYLTLYGELFNHNVISNTFIYDAILNPIVLQ
eukprot:98822_1